MDHQHTLLDYLLRTVSVHLQMHNTGIEKSAGSERKGKRGKEQGIQVRYDSRRAELK